MWCLVTGMVRVYHSKQTGRVGLAEGGGVQGRGRLPLAPGSLVAWGTVTGHLSQPGDEGALSVVETVATDGAAGAFCWQFRKKDPSHGSRHHFSCRCWRSWCCCRGGSARGGGWCQALLNLDFDVFVVPGEAKIIKNHWFLYGF